MSLLLIIIVSFRTSNLVWGGVPQNFHVILQRDEYNMLRLDGVLGPGSAQVRPYLVVRDCGDLDRFGPETFTIHNDDNYAVVDVSDIIEDLGRLAIVCIGYRAAMTRSVESVVWMSSAVGVESLIFRPSNVSTLAHDNTIVYTNVQEYDFVYGVSAVNGMNSSTAARNLDSLGTVTIDPTDNRMSYVSGEVFEELGQAIADAGSMINYRNRQYELHLEEGVNCLEHFIGALPNLHYILSNEQNLLAGGTELVFYPDDYIVQSEQTNVCFLNVHPALPAVLGDGLRITGPLLRRLGGIHFDYANRRIGVFEPVL